MSDVVVVQEPDPQHSARRIPAVAEALGYVGGALALTALVVLVAMFWDELGVWGRTGISAAVAVAGLAGGFAIERLEAPAAKRLGQFLLAIGVVGVGCAVGFLVRHYMLQYLARTMGIAAAGDKSSEWAWFLGMLAGAVSGGLVWWRRRTWLQHLVFGTAVGMSSLLVLPLIPVEGPDWGPGLVLMAVGIAWGALSLRGLLEPDNAGLLLACLGILGGLQLSAISGETAEGGSMLAWAVWLGVAVSMALVVGGVLLKRYVVIGVSAAGLVMFLFELISEVFEMGMGTPIAFLAASLILLAGAAYWLSKPTAAEKRAASVAAEVAGYAGTAFAIVGGAMLVGEYWDDLSTVGRIAVPAVLTLVAYGAALRIERGDTESTRRLSHVLFAAGIGGAAATGAMIAYPIAKDILPANQPERYVQYYDPGNWSSLAAGVTGIIVGALTWWRRSGMPVVIVTGVMWLLAIVSGFSIVPEKWVPYWLAGVVLMAVGLAWMLLALLERLRPSNAALAVGSALTIFSAMMMPQGMGPNSGEPASWPMWLGLAVSVAFVVASIPLRRGVMLGFGAVGVVWYAFRVVQRLFQGQIGAPIMLLIIGVIFIAMAVLVAVVLPRLRGPSQPGALPAV